MNFTDEQAMRIGYLIVRKSPDIAKNLLFEIELEKDEVMELNASKRNLMNTAKYQQDCDNEHRKLYKDMTMDKRSWFKKWIERWV